MPDQVKPSRPTPMPWRNRFTAAEHQIEKRVRRVDDDGASALGGDAVLAAELGWQFGRLIGFRLILRRQSRDPASGGATRRLVGPARRRVVTFRLGLNSRRYAARWRQRVVGRLITVTIARIVMGAVLKACPNDTTTVAATRVQPKQVRTANSPTHCK